MPACLSRLTSLVRFLSPYPLRPTPRLNYALPVSVICSSSWNQACLLYQHLVLLPEAQKLPAGWFLVLLPLLFSLWLDPLPSCFQLSAPSSAASAGFRSAQQAGVTQVSSSTLYPAHRHQPVFSKAGPQEQTPLLPQAHHVSNYLQDISHFTSSKRNCTLFPTHRLTWKTKKRNILGYSYIVHSITSAYRKSFHLHLKDSTPDRAQNTHWILKNNAPKFNPAFWHLLKSDAQLLISENKPRLLAAHFV